MIVKCFLSYYQVLPLAHTSGKNRTEVQIINPQAANLRSYEEKLTAMIELYKRFSNPLSCWFSFYTSLLYGLLHFCSFMKVEYLIQNVTVLGPDHQQF